MGVGIAAAAAHRPKLDLVIVLTDGYTPWPAYKPAGMDVIVGIVGSTRGAEEEGIRLPKMYAPTAPPVPPEWATTIYIS